MVTTEQLDKLALDLHGHRFSHLKDIERERVYEICVAEQTSIALGDIALGLHMWYDSWLSRNG
jgi:hypothetical protein